MSRQSKLRNKKKFRVAHARWNSSMNKSLPTGNKGAKSTTPKHGKVNRWPYAGARRTGCGGLPGAGGFLNAVTENNSHGGRK